MQRLRLGPHWMDEGQDTTNDLLDKDLLSNLLVATMSTAMLRDPNKIAMFNKAKAKGCVLLGKRNESEPDLKAPDMKVEALNYFNGIGQGTDSFPALVKAFPQVDIWCGPNEINLPDLATMEKYAEFLVEFARLMSTLGKQAGLGQWSVGCPDFPQWAAWGPVLWACQTLQNGGYNAVLTRHSYGPLDNFYLLRHRMDETWFNKLGFYGTPVYITECGADKLGGYPGRFNDIWKGPNKIYDYYNNYLRPYEMELRKDAYVLGGHIFTCGNGQGRIWDSFDTAHLPLADAILKNPPDDVQPTPIVVPQPVVVQDEKVQDTVTMVSTPSGSGNGFTVITSVTGPNGPVVDNVEKAVYAFHKWIAALKGTDPGPGPWTTNPEIDPNPAYTTRHAPFTAYSRKYQENRLVIFSSETSTIVKEFRQQPGALAVTKVSANGLRFLVYVDPVKIDPATGKHAEMWVLAAQTQSAPAP
jgi:hypothetical protein